MLNKILIGLLTFCLTTPAFADPRESSNFPPASFKFVDISGFSEPEAGWFPDGAWCYDPEANAVLITAPVHAAKKCELGAELKILRQKAKYDLKVELLKAHVIALEESHSGVLDALKVENTKLTKIALNRPNNYWYLWTAGGFTVGVGVTFALLYVFKSD